MGLDFTPGIYHGPLVEVVEDEGTGLVGDHLAGVTTLTVGSGGAFDLSGSCDVAGNVYTFTRDGETLSITPALVAAADDGDPVISLGLDGRPDTRTQAIVDLDMTGDEDEELPRAWIPGELSGFYPVGTAAAGAIVQVDDTDDGYVVVGRPHAAPPLVDGLLQGGEIVGAEVKTGNTGNRVVMRGDTESGIIEFFPETITFGPGSVESYIEPGIVSDEDIGVLRIRPPNLAGTGEEGLLLRGFDRTGFGGQILFLSSHLRCSTLETITGVSPNLYIEPGTGQIFRIV